MHQELGIGLEFAVHDDDEFVERLQLCGSPWYDTLACAVNGHDQQIVRPGMSAFLSLST